MATRAEPLYIETELGREKRCPQCHEYWPLDREFFVPQGERLHPWCRACYNEWRNIKNRRRRALTRSNP